MAECQANNPTDYPQVCKSDIDATNVLSVKIKDLKEKIEDENAPKEGESMFNCSRPKDANGAFVKDVKDETGKKYLPRAICNASKNLCCGAAKKADAPEITRIEVCYDMTKIRMNYKPKKQPGRTISPPEEEWLFMCLTPDLINNGAIYKGVSFISIIIIIINFTFN